MCGRVFKPGSIVIHNVDLVPTFGLIVDILVFNVDDYYIVYELLETECFSHHYNVYEVSHQMMKEYKLCKPYKLKDNTVLGVYKLESRLYVPLKYHII